MSDSPRLPAPLLRVTLDDGAVLEVQTTNQDLVRWERTQAKHRWPPATEAPLTWQTFLAWSALRREKQIPDALTWETFCDDRCIGVENIAGDDDDDDEDDPAGRPTLPGPGPG